MSSRRPMQRTRSRGNISQEIKVTLKNSINTIQEANHVKMMMYGRTGAGTTFGALDILKDKNLTGEKSKVKFNPTKEFDVIKKTKSDAFSSALQKLVDEHNNSDSLLYTRQDVFKKLGVSNITKKDSPVQHAILDSMDKPEDKVKKAFDKISNKSNKFIENSFKLAFKLIK